MKELEQLTLPLLMWYRENARILPWRSYPTPYRVWVSEIMLQQTRVAAVLEYYRRFMEALPTVEDLAAVPEDELMKLWQGLGYYSRARNLQKAARQIMEEHGGVFPGTYEEIRALSGVGDYTAGAISSIAFGLPTPAVDGNVLRVMARITDNPTPIDLPARKKEVQTQLAAIYPGSAGDFTQALMELGATICGPNRKPDCGICPCREFCLGYQRGTAESLPVKSPKKGRREEDLTVFILRCGDHYALEKRPDSGLLAGLWQFPNIPGKLDAQQAAAWAGEQGLGPRDLRRMAEKKHIFTHIQGNMTGIYLEVGSMPDSYQWFTEEEIETGAALPTAFRQFWEERDYV